MLSLFYVQLKINTFKIMNHLALQSSGLFSELAKRFHEGGPFFMSLILICFIGALVCLALSFYYLKKHPDRSKKMTRLASDISILGLVIGFLGSTFGLVSAFDTVDSIGGMKPEMMAAGLKVSFLTTIFGCITFILPRIGIIVLRGLQKA